MKRTKRPRRVSLVMLGTAAAGVYPTPTVGCVGGATELKVATITASSQRSEINRNFAAQLVI
jgi:hypothetical protein